MRSGRRARFLATWIPVGRQKTRSINNTVSQKYGQSKIWTFRSDSIGSVLALGRPAMTRRDGPAPRITPPIGRKGALKDRPPAPPHSMRARTVRFEALRFTKGAARQDQHTKISGPSVGQDCVQGCGAVSPPAAAVGGAPSGGVGLCPHRQKLATHGGSPLPVLELDGAQPMAHPLVAGRQDPPASAPDGNRPSSQGHRFKARRSTP